MKPSEILWSWDFVVAAIATALVIATIPSRISAAFAKDLFAVGISVLSIVFSVFFAALAIIISAGDNEFILFLEKEKAYTGIVQTFLVSLIALFVALVYSLVLYAITAAAATVEKATQAAGFVCAFSFLFLYGLFAAFNSAIDAIRYARTRAAFLEAKAKKRPPA